MASIMAWNECRHKCRILQPPPLVLQQSLLPHATKCRRTIRPAMCTLRCIIVDRITGISVLPVDMCGPFTWHDAANLPIHLHFCHHGIATLNKQLLILNQNQNWMQMHTLIHNDNSTSPVMLHIRMNDGCHGKEH